MSSRLFALGSNGAGQLGIGHQDDVSTPTECIFNPSLSTSEDVLAIQAGGNHTLLLTSKGRVYATGSGTALPVNVAEHRTFHLLDIQSIFRLPGTSKVTNIATSWDASYIVIDSKVVYACGVGNKGELGIGADKPLARMPQLLLDLRIWGDGSAIVHDVSGGLSHVVLITDDGHVYGWGTSRRGELGEEAKDKKIVWSPLEIDIGFAAARVVTGRNFTFIRGEENQQVLLGNAKHFPGGKQLDLSATTKIFCGWSSLYALESGELQAVGRDDRGQVPLIKLPKLARFAAGSEHGVGCTVDGDVIAFGWGEHGNCGDPIDGRGNVAGRFNTVIVPKRDDEAVRLIAAGCATTFVVVTSTTPH